jgi:hypothetical protein
LLSGKRLLKLDVAIHGDQRIATAGGSAEQLAVVHALPPEPENRLDLVPGKLGSQVEREVLVKQDAHD